MSTSRELAEAIARRLFTDGTHQIAQRLVLTVDTPAKRDLGGWCEAAAVDQIQAVLSASASVEHDIRLMPDFQIVEVLKSRAAHDANDAVGHWLGRLLSVWVTDAPLSELDAIVRERFSQADRAPDLLACCKELREALLVALDVIATRAGKEAADAYVDDLTKRGFEPGIIGLRADGVIAEAEGRPRPQLIPTDPIEPDPRD